ncbi:hypothetical protein ACFQJ8_24525 [Halocatena marina]
MKRTGQMILPQLDANSGGSSQYDPAEDLTTAVVFAIIDAMDVAPNVMKPPPVYLVAHHVIHILMRIVGFTQALYDIARDVRHHRMSEDLDLTLGLPVEMFDDERAAE